MKIAFTGTHCTGKTTLLDQIIEKYSNDSSFGYIPEVARKILEKGCPLNEEANIDSYIHCINDQLAAESAIANSKLFVSDRTLLDTWAYALVSRKLPRPCIQEHFVDMMKNVWLLEKERYDLYVYFPIEFAMVSDGVRPSDNEYREMVDEMIYHLLTKYSVHFVTIKGSMEERKQKIFEIIDNGIASLPSNALVIPL